MCISSCTHRAVEFCERVRGQIELFAMPIVRMQHKKRRIDFEIHIIHITSFVLQQFVHFSSQPLPAPSRGRSATTKNSATVALTTPDSQTRRPSWRIISYHNIRHAVAVSLALCSSIHIDNIRPTPFIRIARFAAKRIRVRSHCTQTNPTTATATASAILTHCGCVQHWASLVLVRGLGENRAHCSYWDEIFA